MAQLCGRLSMQCRVPALPFSRRLGACERKLPARLLRPRHFSRGPCTSPHLLGARGWTVPPCSPPHTPPGHLHSSRPGTLCARLRSCAPGGAGRQRALLRRPAGSAWKHAWSKAKRAVAMHSCLVVTRLARSARWICRDSKSHLSWPPALNAVTAVYADCPCANNAPVTRRDARCVCVAACLGTLWCPAMVW